MADVHSVGRHALDGVFIREVLLRADRRFCGERFDKEAADMCHGRRPS
jgi:hypothetical protein